MEQPKIERVLRLIMMMTGNNNYTIEDMAQRLGISYRSVYRYIETFKDSGFVVQRNGNGIYKLSKESRYFKDLSQLIHFTDEEAHIINQLIEGIDNTNIIKQNLRKKLTSIYNCSSLAECVVDGKNATNVNRLIDAISKHKQVILKNYSSSHSGEMRDRVIEPFGFTTNYIQIWGFEPQSGVNKLFNTSRIESVELLPNDWKYESLHHEGYIDIFRTTGFEQHRVRLELSMMAHNLLIEEYPLSTRDLTQIDRHHWLLDTLVCSYHGIGRFVMGLQEEIKILTPEFQKYIIDKAKRIVEANHSDPKESL